LNAEEVEALACEGGVMLAVEWVRKPSRTVLQSHLRKEQINAVAHELAQVAKRLNHTALWRDRSPTCIEHLVAQDCKTILCNQ
ncbi:hypothetical protein BAE44_0009380, partial [Dichanthelium oligosanthes]